MGICAAFSIFSIIKRSRVDKLACQRASADCSASAPKTEQSTKCRRKTAKLAGSMNIPYPSVGFAIKTMGRRSASRVRTKCGTQEKFSPLEPDSKGFSCEKCRELESLRIKRRRVRTKCGTQEKFSPLP